MIRIRDVVGADPGRALRVVVKTPTRYLFIAFLIKNHFETAIGCFWKPPHFFPKIDFVAFQAMIFQEPRNFYEILETFFVFIKMKSFITNSTKNGSCNKCFAENVRFSSKILIFSIEVYYQKILRGLRLDVYGPLPFLSSLPSPTAYLMEIFYFFCRIMFFKKF